MRVISRFAPSPTGFIHIGNIRTAVLNYLVSRKSGGKFILRIDDTDQERSREKYVDQIKFDLEWLGIEWDRVESQSKRVEKYESVANYLREIGLLYECFETPVELDLKRKMQLNMGNPPVYDRSALKLTKTEIEKLRSQGTSHWRFKLTNERVPWHDEIMGELSIDTASVSDPVLIRGDGQFLYTLASVCDDIDFAITNVVRGSDHITNTATQIQIIAALGGHAPSFAHHSLLTGAKGEPLSKRFGNLSVKELRESGVESQALLIYIARLGSTQPLEQGLGINELIESFELSHFGTNSTKFEVEQLNLFSKKYLSNLLLSKVETYLDSIGVPVEIRQEFWDMAKENVEKKSDIKLLWDLCVNGAKPLVSKEDAEFVKSAIMCMPSLPRTRQSWKLWTEEVSKNSGRKGKKLFLPLRKALTGKETGPDMNKLFPLLKCIRVGF